MKPIKLLFLIGMVAIFSWSCSGSLSPNSNNGGDSTSQAYAKGIKVPMQADSLDQLAKKIPGFGGLFIDKSDQLVLYLTNPATQTAKAKAVLSNSPSITKALAQIRTQNKKYRSVSIANMKIKEAQATFTQLRKWETSVMHNILNMSGVYTTSIDQSQNKISIGVKNKVVTKKVKSKLGQLNIPEGAVAISIISKPELY